MNEDIIKALFLFGIGTAFSFLIAFPILHYLSCGILRPFKEVWVDEQKHNLRVLRRFFINDLTECPICESISVEHIPGLWDHCLKCTYLKCDPEYEKSLKGKSL